MGTKAWQNILSHARFGSVASELCSTVEKWPEKWQLKSAVTSTPSQPVAFPHLVKKPGWRPFGIGEVLRRIIGKAAMEMMEVTKDDTRAAVGSLQVCAGPRAGCEAAVHAMREVFGEPGCDAVSNALNSINRKAAHHNLRIKCPSFAMYIDNLYTQPAKQFISGRQIGRCEIIESAEGTTQGDPVAMAVYAMGRLELQNHTSLKKTQDKQLAYADDLPGAETRNLKEMVGQDRILWTNARLLS